MFEPASTPGGAPAPMPEWIAALKTGGAFTPDARYHAPVAAAETGQPEADAAEDRIAAAFEEGRIAGAAEATKQAGTQTAERRKLGSRLRRMDDDMVQQLGSQLSETIVALCEATLAPLALDRDLLAERCVSAARLLGDSNNDRVLRLNPADIESLDQQFRDEWTILPDADLARGNLRIEGPGGGIADGPAQWRALLRETLGLERI